MSAAIILRVVFCHDFRTTCLTQTFHRHALCCSSHARLTWESFQSHRPRQHPSREPPRVQFCAMTFSVSAGKKTNTPTTSIQYSTHCSNLLKKIEKIQFISIHINSSLFEYISMGFYHILPNSYLFRRPAATRR